MYVYVCMYILAYVMAQIEFLKKLSEKGGDSSKEAISDEGWNQLMAKTDPKVSIYVYIYICMCVCLRMICMDVSMYMV